MTSMPTAHVEALPLLYLKVMPLRKGGDTQEADSKALTMLSTGKSREGVDHGAKKCVPLFDEWVRTTISKAALLMSCKRLIRRDVESTGRRVSMAKTQIQPMLSRAKGLRHMLNVFVELSIRMKWLFRKCSCDESRFDVARFPRFLLYSVAHTSNQ